MAASHRTPAAPTPRTAIASSPPPSATNPSAVLGAMGMYRSRRPSRVGWSITHPSRAAAPIATLLAAPPPARSRYGRGGSSILPTVALPIGSRRARPVPRVGASGSAAGDRGRRPSGRRYDDGPGGWTTDQILHSIQAAPAPHQYRGPTSPGRPVSASCCVSGDDPGRMIPPDRRRSRPRPVPPLRRSTDHSRSPLDEPTPSAVHRGTGPDALLDRPGRESPPGLRLPPRGGRARGRRSPACPSCSARSTSARPRTTRTSTSPSRSPAPPPRRIAAVARETGMVIVASLFERRAAGIYHNTAVVLDADGSIRGHLSEDAHPRRPALLREVLLHPRRPRLPVVRDEPRQRRHARLLGPVVPRGRPPDRPAGRRDPLLSDRHRLAPQREGGVRPRPGRRLDDHAAGPRHRQRRLSSRPSTGSATRAPPTAASNSGAAPSSPTPSAASSPRPSTDSEEVLIVECDPKLTETTRRHWPFLRDRRIDAYSPIVERFLS